MTHLSHIASPSIAFVIAFGLVRVLEYRVKRLAVGVEPVAMGNDNPPHNLRHEVRHITCGGSCFQSQTVSRRRFTLNRSNASDSCITATMSHDSEASTKFAHKSLIVAAVGKQYCGREDRHTGLAPTRIGADNRNNGPRAAEGAELRDR